MDRHESTTSEAPDAKRFWSHAGVLATIGAIIAFALGAAFMSIGHSPQPRDVPVAVVGPAAAAQALEAQAPGQLSVQAVPDVAAAQKLIRERDVYAAVIPGEHGVRELMIASAASNQVANFMRRTLGAATPENAPRIVDAQPLPKDDASGLSIPLLLQILVIGGSIGVVGIGKVLPRFKGDPRHGVLPVSFLAGYALVFGLAVTGIAAAFGVGTDASLIDRVLSISLISFAVTASTAALVSLIGPAGSAVTGTLYFILGAQISGGSTASEFLPPFWSDLGQNLPAGAGTTLLRNVFYFPEASVGGAIGILAAYASVGLIILVAVSLVRSRREARAANPIVDGPSHAVAAGARA
jgi:hypothetical protein